MFYVVRMALIFVFGAGAVAAIEASPVGSFFMGALSLVLTVWLVFDAAHYFQLTR